MTVEKSFELNDTARAVAWYGGDILAQRIAAAGREIAASLERKPGGVRVRIVAELVPETP